MYPRRENCPGRYPKRCPAYVHTRVQQWNLSVQRELSRDITFEAKIGPWSFPSPGYNLRGRIPNQVKCLDMRRVLSDQRPC